MLNCYRVSFDAALVYQFEFTEHDDEAVNSPFALLVYRVRDDRRETHPLRHNDGQPMRFEGATRRTAMALACDILQSIHGKHLKSIVSWDASSWANGENIPVAEIRIPGRQDF